MLNKEKAPKSGALTGNSGINHTKKCTRKSSQKKLKQNKLLPRYIVELAYLVNDLPNSGYEEEFWTYSK